ncbi:MAG: FAD-dependent oxidoreductase [Sulfobacillus sp.]
MALRQESAPGTLAELEPRHAHVEVNQERCAGCQECIIRCPTGALSLDSGDWVAQANDALCVGCRQCERVCPYSAILVSGPVVVTAPVRPVAHHPAVLDLDTTEIRQGFTSWQQAMTEATRCLSCPDPTCLKGCPAHNDIPAFIAAIRDHDLDKAHGILSQTTALPDICSRVCDQTAQCEGACSWTLAGERPVSIGLLERFITDQQPVPGPQVTATDGHDLSVAVVGSGPAGLAAAWELVAHGAQVTVYERDLEPLGVLAWGIPSFSLPDQVAKRPIDALRQAGVSVRLGIAIGKDVMIDELLGMHDAVILTHGASVPMRMAVPGVDLAGVEDATHFLKRAKYALQQGTHLSDIQATTRVLVIGAGNTAMDVARSVRRLGGQATAVDWMDEHFARVRRDELAEARAEGVVIRFSTSVERLEGKAGQVDTALLRHTRQRRASELPKVTDETTEAMACDLVVMAMGYRVDSGLSLPYTSRLPLPRPNLTQAIPDRRWLASGILSQRGSVGQVAYEREQGLEQAKRPQGDRVWVAGDALVGPSTVVGSMAQGKAAAQAVLAIHPRRGVLTPKIAAKPSRHRRVSPFLLTAGGLLVVSVLLFLSVAGFVGGIISAGLAAVMVGADRMLARHPR